MNINNNIINVNIFIILKYAQKLIEIHGNYIQTQQILVKINL